MWQNMLVKFIVVAGNSKGSPAGTCGKGDFLTFRSENRFLVFNSHINVAGYKLDILFRFPNDWYNDIDGYVKKIKIDFLPLPNIHKSKMTIFVYICVQLVKTKNQF